MTTFARFKLYWTSGNSPAKSVLAILPEHASCVADRPNLAAWSCRLRAEPGVDPTYPTHWAVAPTP